MKRLAPFVLFIFLLSTQHSFAQDNDVYVGKKNFRPGKKEVVREQTGDTHINTASCRKGYIGFSLGINNPAGVIGIDMDIALAKHFSLAASVGTSTWGNKFAVSARYYRKPCHRGWAFGAGVTHNMGLKNFDMNMETIYGTETVRLDLNPQTNAFIAAYHFWTIGKRANRLFVEMGYSMPFAPYSYTQKIGDPLTSTSETVLRILSPRGLMLGVGFSFGMIK